MSGIVGIVDFSAAPVDPELLRRLTASLAFRGPDGWATWSAGGAGLGHTMLRATTEARGERQPLSIDGDAWILADARIDGRDALRGELLAAGVAVADAATDPELILHAYRAWGEDCVRHLIGDFAFAIWEIQRRRLFCARDHFGVKPFFYARAGSCLIFGNTLACLRRHPRVSGAIDDGFVADFLAHGVSHDPGATAFEAVRRLPPAHRLVATEGSVAVQRYWHLPAGERLRYRRAADYVEHFSEHLAEAVRDRLRGDRVAVLMSGGMDSTAVAAVARDELERRRASWDLRAYTCVFRRLFEDEEGGFAARAAAALGIPIHYLVADDYALFERWPTFAFPEPVDEPLAAIYIDQARQMAPSFRVALTGWDGDSLLGGQRQRFGDRLYKGIRRAGRAAAAIPRGLAALGHRLSDFTSDNPDNLLKHRESFYGRPAWLAPDIAAGRAAVNADRRPVTEARGSHPRARRGLASPLLSNLLESYDPGVTRVPVETRHPLLDVRLVTFVLSLPEVPWCIDKTLLREAMRDRLPEAVRTRPKSPLAGDPVVELLRRPEAAWVDAFRPNPALARFVRRASVPSLTTPRDPDAVWTDLRPLCLNLWLDNVAGADAASGHEDYHEVA